MSRTTPAPTRTYEDDVISGLALEGELLPVLRKHYKADLNRQSRYDHFDFVDSTKQMYVELKGRRCRWGQYYSLWVNLEKVAWANEQLSKNPDMTFYFVIQCCDELVQVKYDPEIFKDYKVSIYKRKDRDRNDLAIPVVNVPVCHFSRVRPDGVRLQKSF